MVTLADSIWTANLLSPPVLFFFLGAVAAWARSDLEIPPAFTKMLSLYLLWAIGFKGGVQLQSQGLGLDVLRPILGAMLLSAVIPLYVFPLMKKRLGVPTAAGVAATYGSVSVVTFLAATAFLTESGIAFGGHMVAATALMESPAVIVSVLLARTASQGGEPAAVVKPGRLAHDALLNSAVVLLVGSLIVGFVSATKAQAKVLPLSNDLFYGLLCFFLLDLGLMAGRSTAQLLRAGWFVAACAVLVPLFNAALGLAIARALGMPRGDGFLLTVLAASASYIAVPAAMKLALPDARQEVFVPMALTFTFPFNVSIGLPLYWKLAEAILPG